ncbi:MAG: AMP-binding protein [Burkholderiales bacterium]|nr:AMP-binding protein [Burkholderiales bacterium]
MMRCPKCHQPLADQDEGLYICCADAPMQWHCTGCGKVSEGFAFPYGRCPHCGGQLALRDESTRADGDEATAMAAVRTAFEIELGGRAFYQRAAVDCDDNALRALFRRFAVMEGEHMETLSRRYHLETPNPSPEFQVETAAIHAGLGDAPRDPEGLFRIAIALEKKAAGFFAARAERTAPASAERRFYEELAAEEREHAEILASEYARWRARLPGLLASGDPFAEAVRTGRPRDVAEDVQVNAAAMLIAAHDPGRIAIECAGERMTYGELRDRVARAAAVWRARGLRPGDRVAVKLPDSLDWVVCWLGTIWAGGIAVGVNPRVPTPEWHYILEEAGFNVIVAESADDTPEPWRSRVIPLAEGRRAVAAAQPVEPLIVHEDTPAFWLHTSGTSGKPKAVVHAHRCVREVGRISAERMGITASDRLYASSKLFFAYPLTNLLLAGLRIGATLIIDPQWPTAQSVAETVTATRPTVFFSVPSLYRNLLHEKLATGFAAAGVRRCVSAGEALPQSLRTAWRDATRLPMIDGYGASEVLVLVLTAVDGDDGLQPSPGTAVEPVDADAAAAGMPTRLLIGSAMQALGYLDRPAAQADSFRSGRFCPADLFLRTPGGGWRFAGREDSLVKIKGRWVNLVELEERLGAGLSGLREGAAVCIPDADGMDAVAYFFAAGDGDGEKVRRALDERIAALPHYQRPALLHAIETLPRTATGKLLRRKLVEQVRAG